MKDYEEILALLQIEDFTRHQPKLKRLHAAAVADLQDLNDHIDDEPEPDEHEEQ